MGLFKKRKRCLVCNKKVSKNASVIKYRYKGDDGEPALGEAHICTKCANKYEKMHQQGMPDEPI